MVTMRFVTILDFSCPPPPSSLTRGRGGGRIVQYFSLISCLKRGYWISYWMWAFQKTGIWEIYLGMSVLWNIRLRILFVVASPYKHTHTKREKLCIKRWGFPENPFPRLINILVAPLINNICMWNTRVNQVPRVCRLQLVVMSRSVTVNWRKFISWRSIWLEVRAN